MNVYFENHKNPVEAEGHVQSSRSHGSCVLFVCMILHLPTDSTLPWVKLENLVY